MPKKLFFFLAALVLTNYSYACKQRAEVDSYPLDEVTSPNFLVEATVSGLKGYSEGLHSGTKSFKATILQSFKGGLSAGNTIDVSAAQEEAHAVCPVSFEEGKTYILVLSRSKEAFEISRFNLAIRKEDRNYKQFIKQLQHASKP